MHVTVTAVAAVRYGEISEGKDVADFAYHCKIISTLFNIKNTN